MRILLIEDNEDHAILCCMALCESHHIKTVGTLGEGLAALAEEPAEAIITDLTLPDAAGIAVVKQVRAAAKTTPLLVLTSHDSEDLDAEVIDAGAQDYLVKSEVLTNPKSARSAIKRALGHATQRHRLIGEKEHLVRELQSSQQQLLQLNNRLIELCRTAETFVENVSHEFRTPLTIIREYTSLIREGVVGEVNDQQAQMLSVVEDRSDDLNTMVDDLLDVSRLEAGIISVRRGPCCLPTLLDRVLPPLVRKAEVRDVHLSFDIPDDLPDIWADSEKISRALINLVVNAIKFAGQPGLVAIRVQHAAERGEVHLMVKDNGPGIPKDQAEAIYDRFCQPVTSFRQSTKGFGLGLGIAKELVDLNLGEMTLKSVEEVGSTFGFTVPVADPLRVFERHLGRLDKIRFQGSIELIEIAAIATSDRDKQDLEGLILDQLGCNDQLFQNGPDRWIAVSTTEPCNEEDFILKLQAAHARQSRNRPRGPLPQLRAQSIGDTRLDDTSLPVLLEDFTSLLDNCESLDSESVACHA